MILNKQTRDSVDDDLVNMHVLLLIAGADWHG